MMWTWNDGLSFSIEVTKLTLIRVVKIKYPSLALTYIFSIVNGNSKLSFSGLFENLKKNEKKGLFSNLMIA